MKRTKQLLSLFLALALVMSFAAVPVLAAGDTADAEEKESIPEGNQTEGNWVYEVAEAQMGGPGGGPGGPGEGRAEAPAAENRHRKNWTPLWR